MIFYFKTNGHLVYNSQVELFQGSNGANTVYVVAPFAFSSQVSASITLPNGKKIINQYLTRRKDLSAEYFSIDNVGLSVWSFDIPYSITKLTGIALVQFAFTSSTETVTTESVRIAIRKGVYRNDDIEIGDSNILEDIKKYIAFAQEKVDSCEGKLDKVESETTTKQAYVKRANGVQSMVDVDELKEGSIVQRKVDGNIYAGEPESSYDATPKYYVDNGLTQIRNNHFDKTEIETKLSNYYNKNDIDDKLSYRYTKNQVDSKLDNYYYTKEQTNEKLTNNYYTQSEVDNKLSNYSNNTQLREKLDNYTKKDEIDTKLQNYLTDDQLTERLFGFPTISDVNAKMGKYYPKTTIDKNYYKKTEVDSRLNEKANISDLNQKQDILSAGDNISLDNNKISVVGDEYELIEKAVIGYSILITQPSDWDSNYTNYYKNVGTIKEPTYESLSSLESWEVGKYYSFNIDGSQNFIRTTETDGTPYNFKKIRVIIDAPICPKSATGYVLCMVGRVDGFSYTPNLKTADTSNKCFTVCEVYCTNDKMYHFSVSSFLGNNRTVVDGKCFNLITEVTKTFDDYNIKKVDTYVYSGSSRYAGGTVIKIYGVR